MRDKMRRERNVRWERKWIKSRRGEIERREVGVCNISVKSINWPNRLIISFGYSVFGSVSVFNWLIGSVLVLKFNMSI